MKKLHLTKTIKTSATLFALALCSNYGFSQTNLVQNPGVDFYTNTTSDNADAYDMTPNSKLKDNTGTEITSPFRFDADDNPTGWRNQDLHDFLDNQNGDINENPSSTSDGAFVDGSKTRGLKLDTHGRRIYQYIPVTQGTSYTFSVDTRAESALTSTQIFILNNQIVSEDGTNGLDPSDASYELVGSAPAQSINVALGTSSDVDGYLAPNDINSSKGDASTNTFTTSTITFTATTNDVVIYIRALGANKTDGDDSNNNELFVDNLSLVETSTLSNNIIDAKTFDVYPNPVKDVLNIESSENEITSVSVRNMLGQELISSEGKVSQLNVSSLASGVYLVVIKSGDKIAIKKIVKK